MKSIVENFHSRNFIQPCSGLEWIFNFSLTMGETHGYSGITTSWFESWKSLKGLKLNSPGLSEAQPWVSNYAQNRRNQVIVQGCEGTMRRDIIKMDKDDLLNPSRRALQALIGGLQEGLEFME